MSYEKMYSRLMEIHNFASNEFNEILKRKQEAEWREAAWEVFYDNVGEWECDVFIQTFTDHSDGGIEFEYTVIGNFGDIETLLVTKEQIEQRLFQRNEN